jgi:hypothetical protein
MTRLFFTFRKEPREQIYRDLINYAVSKGECQYGFLIVHPGESLAASGGQALERLSPSLHEVTDVSEWPGTKLLSGNTVKRYKYNFGLDFAEAVKTLAQGLYDWEHPRLPEDLSLMIDEKKPWLFTIAHEKDAVLCLTPDELVELQRNQALRSILIKDDYYKEND